MTLGDPDGPRGAPAADAIHGRGAVVQAARRYGRRGAGVGFAAVAANDHFVFSTPWLDGPTALASMIERSGDMTLATTVALPVLRGPVALAKALAAIDVISEGPLIAALGPGSSSRDYEAIGIPFDERWKRFDEAVVDAACALERRSSPAGCALPRAAGGFELEPSPGGPEGSRCGSEAGDRGAGLDRVAGLADGWLASAYNTTPERFAAARGPLATRARRPRPRCRRVSECPRHDVDLGLRGECRG